jgi:thiol peroxidase
MARTVTLKGDPIELEGPELKVGDKAPDVSLKKDLGTSIKLSETNGRPRILSVVPSLDTPVCAEQTKRFNTEAAGLAGVDIFTISVDLPPAQARFCGAEGIDPERVRVLSDHVDTQFCKAFGTLIPALRISARALFVLDAGGTIQHVEYVGEVADHPNYDAALACAKKLAG